MRDTETYEILTLCISPFGGDEEHTRKTNKEKIGRGGEWGQRDRRRCVFVRITRGEFPLYLMFWRPPVFPTLILGLTSSLTLLSFRVLFCFFLLPL